MPLSFQDIKNHAHQFVMDYTQAVKENAESQSFLNDFFAIFGVNRKRVASFEQPVKTDEKGTKRIDLFWPGVLLVEMKSTGQSLSNAYQQGVGYFKGLKDQDLPRYIMVCDLNTFKLYDLEGRTDYTFALDQLPDNLHLFDFMQGKAVQDISEVELNIKAADLLGDLHDALEQSGFSGHDLQVFMVRVLFCLFAEDTGVFNRHQFTQYLLKFTCDTGNDTEMHLQRLFQVLDQAPDQRNKNLMPELQAFPYVNGHLFKERIDMPFFTSQMRNTLIECCLFNWRDISPAIFGSLFQSIMDKTARRNLGAHYTSEANILKTIEPLFLTRLKTQLNDALKLKSDKARNQKLQALTTQIRHLTFLDPACGCGNFLIITYRELRRLELQILHVQRTDQSQGHIELEIQPAIPLNNFMALRLTNGRPALPRWRCG
nr:class I SAM-dependent DNA methyltransferase [Thiomicrorhabdus aquaedulcis]